jgi:hypothetical protein
LKVRNAYLANLDAQIKNLDKTKNAVAILNQTGQTPLTPQDTRTVTEKLADVDRLRIDLRKRLLTLTDGREIGTILSVLTADEVQAASIVLDDIINQLKPKYALGVPAPIFIEYLRRYITDYNKTVGFVSNLRPDLQDQYDQAEILSTTSKYMQDQLQADEDQKETTAFAQELRQQENDAIIAEELEREQFNLLVGSISPANINAVSDLIATKYVKRMVNTGNKVINPVTKRMVNEKEERLERQSAAPTDALRSLAKSITALDLISPDEMKFIPKNKSLAIKYLDYLSRRDSGRPIDKEIIKELNSRSQNELWFEVYKYKGGSDLKPPEAIPEYRRTKRSKKQSEKEAKDTTIDFRIGQMGAAELSDYSVANDKLISVSQFLDLDPETRVNYLVALQQRGFWDNAPKIQTDVAELLSNQMTLTERKMNKLYTNIKTISGKGFGSKLYKKATRNLIIGKGLAAKKDFTHKIDFSGGIPKDKTYIPFGRYVLNKHRLNDNRLMIKTIKGGAVLALPTLAISPDLSKIIKKMIGGGLPSYNEMNALSEDEQDILYKVFKLSNVDKSDMLPAPNKTKEEQEMNKFMILKGEIQAGNDSKEMIKEFKVMLMRFIHSGKIPKSQGMDIICELMMMGY